MQNINCIDSDSLWRRAFNFILAFVLFLPAVLTAQQYQQTNLASETQMEGTHAPDPDLKNPWGTGATIAHFEKRRFLYVADLEAAKIKIYNTDFQLIKDDRNAFDGDQIPPGFAPFNIHRPV